MGFLSQIAPIAGGAIGGFFGGPAGAALGTSLGGAVGGLGDSAITAYGERQTTKLGRDTARSDAATAWSRSKQSAQTQMDYQERMSNTSYQRGIEDMRKAGINPILAYKHGGASAPSGAMASVRVFPQLFLQYLH